MESAPVFSIHSTHQLLLKPLRQLNICAVYENRLERLLQEMAEAMRDHLKVLYLEDQEVEEGGEKKNGKRNQQASGQLVIILTKCTAKPLHNVTHFTATRRMRKLR